MRWRRCPLEQQKSYFKVRRQDVGAHAWARAARAGERSEKFVETFKTVGQKIDRARYGVDEPAKDNFGCQKRVVALEKLLEGVRVFLPFFVVGIRRSEGSVDTMEQNPVEAPLAFTAPLRQQDKIVHIAIGRS